MSCTRLVACLFLVGAATTYAQHSDILVTVSGDGALETRAADSQALQRVFEADLGESGLPGFGDEPGWISEALGANELLGYEISGPLLYWDPLTGDFAAPPNGERLEISVLGTTLTVVTGNTTPGATANFAQADANGAVHQHIGFWVQHPDFDADQPLTNPIADGAWVLQLAVHGSTHTESLPFAIVLNRNLLHAQFEDAVEAVVQLLAPACPNDPDGTQCDTDLTADCIVNNQDLGALLAAYLATDADANFKRAADFNHDHVIDNADLGMLLADYLNGCN